MTTTPKFQALRPGVDPELVPLIIEDATTLLEKGHCTRNFACDSRGRPVHNSATEASSFCAIGAVRRALEDRGLSLATCEEINPLYYDVRDSILTVLKSQGWDRTIVEFSDTRPTPEVLELMRSTSSQFRSFLQPHPLQ